MGLEIIGAGFGRTGTFSTQKALNELGYPCYHMFEVLKNPANKGHMDFWHRVAHGPEGAQHNWEEVFGNYRATVDNPGCCVWRELLQAYPDARVLLNVHPKGPDTWFDSTMETIYFTEGSWQGKVLRTFVPPLRKFADMASRLIWQRSHRNTMPDRAAAIARYNGHIEEVKAAVPPDRLLVFSVDQGWEPLCRFLNVPVPDTPFPRVNDRKEFQQNIRNMKLMAYVVIAFEAVLTAGLVYTLYRILG